MSNKILKILAPKEILKPFNPTPGLPLIKQIPSLELPLIEHKGCEHIVSANFGHTILIDIKALIVFYVYI